ncbi:unnamed protein product, partial [Ascophyllum nodosum]
REFENGSSTSGGISTRRTTGDVPGEMDNFAPDEGCACSGGEAT